MNIILEPAIFANVKYQAMTIKPLWLAIDGCMGGFSGGEAPVNPPLIPRVEREVGNKNRICNQEGQTVAEKNALTAKQNRIRRNKS
jgi:hypothetical protein